MCGFKIDFDKNGTIFWDTPLIYKDLATCFY